MRNKKIIGFGIIALLLIVLNPTASDFDNYLTAIGKDEMPHNGGRTSYFLVFSIYQYNYTSTSFSGSSHSSSTEKTLYIGILKNFFEI